MKLSIGNISVDEKTVLKDYDALALYEDVKVKDTTNIINPTFVITTPQVIQANYCYCEDWNKYYYIDSVDVLTGGRVVLNCRVDVLMTYREQIYSLSVIIDKQQDVSKANMYLDDGSLVAENKITTDVISFSNGFSNNGNYILVVAGG